MNAPHRYFDTGRQYRTGGLGSRDMAFIACVDNTNRGDYVMRAIDCGGPLDAPDVMPAGGCESRLFVDWRSNALAHTLTVERAA